MTSKTGHNKAWVYDIRDPLGKVHFKRPRPSAPGRKSKRPGSTVTGAGVFISCATSCFVVLCFATIQRAPGNNIMHAATTFGPEATGKQQKKITLGPRGPVYVYNTADFR